MAKIIWSDEGRDDLDELYLYLCKKDEVKGQKWLNGLFDDLELVIKFPYMGRMVNEANLHL